MSNGSDDDKGFTLFGNDISKIPCFRSTFLNGAGTGVGVGLVYFFLTSKPKTAAKVGYGAFVVSSLTYWCYCRYHYAKTYIELIRAQETIAKKLLYEGTVKDIDISEFEKQPQGSRK